MAGVYIKGMEMPSCCGECRFLDEYGDYPCCIVTDEQRGYNFRIRELRMPHCPLIPVPDHGRLIEKHDVFKLISAFPEIDRLLTVEFMKALYNLPTIIPASKEDRE